MLNPLLNLFLKKFFLALNPYYFYNLFTSKTPSISNYTLYISPYRLNSIKIRRI